MLEALQKGDEVVTAGGLVGKIAKLTDQYATRRDRAERRDQRAARRHLATAAQGHDQGALTHRDAAAVRTATRPRTPLGTLHSAARHESLSALEIHRHRRRAGRRRPVHAAQFLSGGAGRAGQRAQGEGRHRAARHGRGRAEGREHSLSRRGARRDRHQGPLRRHRHAAEGEGRAAGEARRQLHRRAEPAVVVAAVADVDRRAADVPRASTCAAACISCCRST